MPHLKTGIKEQPIRNGDGILYPSELKSNWQIKYINKFLDSFVGYRKIKNIYYQKEYGVYFIYIEFVGTESRQIFSGKTHFENYYKVMNTAHKNITKKEMQMQKIKYKQAVFCNTTNEEPQILKLNLFNKA